MPYTSFPIIMGVAQAANEEILMGQSRGKDNYEKGYLYNKE